MSSTSSKDTSAFTHDNFGEMPRVGQERIRGSWKIDPKTGTLVEAPRADSYADMIEREARKITAQTSKIVKIS